MTQRRIQLGVIGRPHGVRGLVHVHAFTEDPAELPDYGPFTDERGRVFSLRWAGDGVAAITELVDGKKIPVSDRTAASRWVNAKLLVERDRLPAPDDDEFYLADLIGLEAVAEDGAVLGHIDAVHDYGAGASLEIGPLLVPFSRVCVPGIDLAAGRVTISPPQEVS
jgi:16S rRNA processing protein RimM